MNIRTSTQTLITTVLLKLHMNVSLYYLATIIHIN